MILISEVADVVDVTHLGGDLGGASGYYLARKLDVLCTPQVGKDGFYLGVVLEGAGAR
jgi:hypothetical protein